MTADQRAAFRLDEWCARWQISRGTAYNLVKRKQLRLIKIGSATLVTAEEDDAFKQRREEAAEKDFDKSSKLRRIARANRVESQKTAHAQAKLKMGRTNG